MLNETRTKVLIADDDLSRRQLIRGHLESANYWVVEANRLAKSDPTWEDDEKKIPSVQQLLRSHFFHVAIIDLSFKQFDNQDRTGFEVLTTINNYKEGTKSIILTGHGEPPDVRKAWRELGAFDYLGKDDYSRETLLGLVEGAVKQAELRIDALLRNNLTYYDLVQKPRLSEVKETLQRGGEQEIRSVVEKALRPYFPYASQLKSATFGSRLIGGVKHPFLLVKLWSRYLNEPLKLYVGSREVCEYRVDVLEDNEKEDGRDFERVEYAERDDVVGLVVCQSGTTFEKFDSQYWLGQDEPA